MTAALWLLAMQGVLGAFDTLYYHEYRARLVALPSARGELWLHAIRSFIYSVIFATLPLIQWRGAFAWCLGVLIVCEICITIADFIEEDAARRPLGGVFAGERASHTVMALIYGAVLAHLAPILWNWSQAETGFAAAPLVSVTLRTVLAVMAAGVFVSGLRDLLAAVGFARAAWPWKVPV